MADIIGLDDKKIRTDYVYDTNQGKTQEAINESQQSFNTQLTTPYYFCGYYVAAGDVSFTDIVKFNSVISQRGDCYDSSTGLFTCPVSGLYFASFNYYSNSPQFNSAIRPTIFKNGSLYIMTDVQPSNLATILYCDKGDTLAAGTYFTDAISFFAGRGHNEVVFALIQPL